MKRNHLAYLAGFFDAEGYVGIKKTTKGRYLGLECDVKVAGEYMPRLYQFYFSGSVKKLKYKKRYDYWAWQITARRALVFLEAITPFLVLKKPQAELGIAFQYRKMRRRQGRGSYTPEARVLEEADRILMRRLKDQSYGDFEQETLGLAQTREVKHARAKGGQLEFPLEVD